MHVLITGATGNVGSALLRALADEPAVTRITGLARRRPDHEPAKTRWVTGDLREVDVDALCADADAVVHLAWQLQPSRDRAQTRSVNIDGSRRVLDAALAAGVPTVVHSSSMGAYAAARGPVTEEHDTSGIPTSFYSREKAEFEDVLDELERRHADRGSRVVRLRPAPVVQAAAAAELRRFFFGPFFPGRLVRPGRLPLVPLPRGLRFQVVHADDLADAFRRAIVDGTMHGAYNVAGEPVLGVDDLAAVLGGRPLRLPVRLLRGVTWATWKARLQPTPPGWLDLGMDGPLIDTTRLRGHGWEPQVDGRGALDEVLGAMADGRGGPTPPLDAEAGGKLRGEEVRSGLGGRN